MVAKLYKLSLDEVRDALDGYDTARALHQELWDADEKRKKQIKEAKREVDKAFASIS
jgi:hypothetical protein